MRRAAFVLGVLAGLAYLGCSRLLLRLRVDDPLEACAVHGGCSLVGILGAPPGRPAEGAPQVRAEAGFTREAAHSRRPLAH
jgi:ammonia channel protein AmtB